MIDPWVEIQKICHIARRVSIFFWMAFTTISCILAGQWIGMGGQLCTFPLFSPGLLYLGNAGSGNWQAFVHHSQALMIWNTKASQMIHFFVAETNNVSRKMAIFLIEMRCCQLSHGASLRAVPKKRGGLAQPKTYCTRFDSRSEGKKCTRHFF